ncbi:sugar transferase [Lachnospiraceae bacterium NSJ-143]|nr:sugar transferase [Lachnospiraceae bacterium NSJ-143]
MSDKRRKNKFILIWEILLNVAGMTLIFAIIWFCFYRYNLRAGFLYKKGTALMFGMYGVLYLFLTGLYGGHKIGYYRISEIMYSQFLSMIMVNAFTYFQTCLIDRRFIEIKPIIIMCFIDTFFIFFWSVWCNKRFRKRNIVRNMTVICETDLSDELIKKMNYYDYKFHITKQLGIKNGISYILDNLDISDGVIIADVDSEMKKKIIDFCFDRSMPVFVIPDVSEIVLKNSYALNLMDMPVLVCNKGELSLIDEFSKRLFDLAVSFAALAVLWPFMLITAIAIKVYDRGPVFYKQKRLTIGRREFYVYKFRSMVVNAENDGVARLAKQNDSRITPVGRLIRKIRLDELPQIFNVIKGDMSIVGPRPERPEIAAQYEKYIPEFKYRLKMKAGITGYAQVLGRYNTDPYDKLMWDLMYIAGYSFLLDIRLIMMTIKVLFIPESTQGVGKKEVTAQRKKKGRV